MPKSRWTNQKWEVYVLIDPSDKLPTYVGCAQDARWRVAKHALDGVYIDSPLGHWLLKLQNSGLFPEYEILDRGIGHGWEAVEKHWIAHYKDRGIVLLNRTAGGAGAPKREVSLASRIRMSQAHAGQKPTEANKIARLAGIQKRKARLQKERGY